MDVDNGVRVDCGNGRLVRWREPKGRNWDNCNSINDRAFLKNKKFKIVNEKIQDILMVLLRSFNAAPPPVPHR